MLGAAARYKRSDTTSDHWRFAMCFYNVRRSGLESDSHGNAKVFALNSSNGSERWSFESDNYILQKPFISEDVLHVGGSYYDPSQDVDEGGLMRIYALNT